MAQPLLQQPSLSVPSAMPYTTNSKVSPTTAAKSDNKSRANIVTATAASKSCNSLTANLPLMQETAKKLTSPTMQVKSAPNKPVLSPFATSPITTSGHVRPMTNVRPTTATTTVTQAAVTTAGINIDGRSSGFDPPPLNLSAKSSPTVVSKATSAPKVYTMPDAVINKVTPTLSQAILPPNAVPIPQAKVSIAAPVTQTVVAKASPALKANMSKATIPQADLSQATPVKPAAVNHQSAPVSQAVMSKAAPVTQAVTTAPG